MPKSASSNNTVCYREPLLKTLRFHRSLSDGDFVQNMSDSDNTMQRTNQLAFREVCKHASLSKILPELMQCKLTHCTDRKLMK